MPRFIYALLVYTLIAVVGVGSAIAADDKVQRSRSSTIMLCRMCPVKV